MSLTIVKAFDQQMLVVKSLLNNLLESEGQLTEINAEKAMTSISVPSIESHCVFIAYDDKGDPIGGFFGSVCEEMEACIGIGTWVDPAHRRKGLATSLRDAAKAYLKQQGIPKITGFIRVDNKLGLAATPKGAILTHHYYEIPV